MNERADGQLRVIKAVVNTLRAAGISAWLFGGWGLDARIGRITREHGELRTLGDKYVPRPVFEQFTPMNDAFAGEHPGRRLLIQSCYRSPAYQVAVFVGLLVTRYDGDIGRTIRHASPPSYSQHTIGSKAAIDFKNVDGSPSAGDPGDFAATAEYAWLRQHAAAFRFHESWPPGNEFGMLAEPWHWQYRPLEPGPNRALMPGGRACPAGLGPSRAALGCYRLF